ncbi:MAG: twin transmembrane helix small protein [Rhodospirillales bacterium]|nr:twin transmembrane helix small protein [Rhodospirillales bacterium]MCB9995871.1 twin transmembrane helix small protein [Rhodospirillales bacterium]
MNIFTILIILAMLAVLLSLVMGLAVMAKGGETSKKYSNKLMQARVTLQGIALLLFALAVLSQGS